MRDTADFADLPRSFAHVARAVARAASRRQSILLLGPPGLAATMIARRIVTLLPPLSDEERQEVTWARIAAGLSPDGPIEERPFRAPHHTASPAAIAGSARHLGELALARHGVLFLDGATEFPRAAIDAVRDVRRRGALRIRAHLYSARSSSSDRRLPVPADGTGAPSAPAPARTARARPIPPVSRRSRICSTCASRSPRFRSPISARARRGGYRRWSSSRGPPGRCCEDHAGRRERRAGSRSRLRRGGEPPGSRRCPGTPHGLWTALTGRTRAPRRP